MAFPTIPTVAGSRILFQGNTAGGATKTSPSLTSLTKNAGDLLIAICVIYDGNSTNAEFSSWGGSFTEFGDFATTTTMGIGMAYKWSTGSETGTFTVTTADTSTNDSVFILMSIEGAHASTPPEAGGYATGTAAAANPAAFDPAGWAAEDTLWISVAGGGEVSTTGSFTGVSTTPPTGFSGAAVSAITADVVGGVNAGVAFRQINTSNLDVDGWSVDTSNARNAAAVIAVRPAPANQDVSVTGLGSAASFGSVTIATGNVNVAVSGKTTAAAFGTVTASTTGANQTQEVTGLGSAAAFGTVTISTTITVAVTGLGSAASFGSVTAAPGNRNVSVTGLGSAAAFGTTQVNVTCLVPGLSGTHSFGAVDASTSGGGQTQPVTGLGSAASFGTVTTLAGNVTVSVTGLGSAAAFGVMEKVNIAFTVPGLTSAAQFGAITVATGPVTVSVAGLGTAAHFGSVSASTPGGGGETLVEEEARRRVVMQSRK